MKTNKCAIVKDNNKYTAGDFDITKSILMIITEAKKELLDDWIRRLSKASQEDVIFPLAGQEFRNKVIEFIEEEKEHLGKINNKV